MTHLCITQCVYWQTTSLNIAFLHTHTQTRQHALGWMCGTVAKKPLGHLWANIMPPINDHTGGIAGQVQAHTHRGEKLMHTH